MNNELNPHPSSMTGQRIAQTRFLNPGPSPRRPWHPQQSTCPILLWVAISQVSPKNQSALGSNLFYFQGSSNSSILSASPQSFYSQYGYFMQSPYNTMAYGSPWPPPAPVPVSNYSTLNGATTSSSTSSPTQSQQQPAQPQQSPTPQQSQQPHPSTTNHMIIE